MFSFPARAVPCPIVRIGVPVVFLSRRDGQLARRRRFSSQSAGYCDGFVTWMGGRGFASTILYLIGGIILTLMVQSSSAAMAITITCALNGWLGDVSDPMLVFRNSAAIVLGENIGTTVTAWLASLGANVSAKRAARAHFTFNVIGVIWMLIVFVPFTRFAWNLTDAEAIGNHALNIIQSGERSGDVGVEARATP